MFKKEYVYEIITFKYINYSMGKFVKKQSEGVRFC